MSKPRDTWWGYAKSMIRRYPSLAAQEKELHRVSMAINYSGTPGSGNVSHPTEDAALRELPPSKQAELEAVRTAIRQTEQKANGKEVLALVNLVFWRQTHTLSGAAVCLHISYKTAVNWHREFIRAVARARGLTE